MVQTISIWPQSGGEVDGQGQIKLKKKEKQKLKRNMNCNKHTKNFIFHDHLTKYVITYISYETKNKK